MLYYLYEMQRLWAAPVQLMAEGAKVALKNPFNPLSHMPASRIMGSAVDMLGHFTQRYGKPEWNIDSTEIDGRKVDITIKTAIERTYCDLTHFKRAAKRNDPKLLILAPLSGHFATLVRGTVEAMLPDHDVYVSDWRDSSMIPAVDDSFDLDDYIDYLVDFLHFLGPNTHVLAVCQPSVPALAATAIMSGWQDNCVPASLTMIGGPIDTRKSPTQVNKLAKEHSIDWFERHVVVDVPPPYPGAFRKVYPGFIQLTNFIAMNFDKHVASYHELFQHLVQGDDDAADRKRAFYEEYRSVMDLPAEFYLQTVKVVFQDHALPKGDMVHRWHPVKTEKITDTAILCIEGELDDISGIGQTKAALDITPNLADEKKMYHLQKGVGHYGVFNGGKWRREIAPKVKEFIRTHDRELNAVRDAAD
jgi:poly(3-hydroxybutyrate) depolymerase